MSKKNQDQNQEATEVTETVVNRTRQAIDEVGREPSLKAIAAALNVPPQRIYSVAKQPKAGEIYDARVYNWDAIDRFVTRRLDPDVIPTHADLVQRALELDDEFQANDGRKRTRSGGATKAGIVCSNGNLMPARKMALQLGDHVMIRKEAALRVYEIVMMTDTHVVMQLLDTSELTCYSNWTVNQQLIGPAQVEEVYAERKAALEAPEAAPAEDDIPEEEVAE